MGVLTELEPKNVFYYFEEICAIPHGSGNTDAIRRYLCDFAVKHSLDHTADDIGNVIIYKPASPGYEGIQPLILQGHMDMVAVCTPDSGIDMTTHSLELMIEGDFLSARDTSLGGDDGVAVAMMLAVLSSDDYAHPAIEAVFTMDEETGMDGARDLDVSCLRGRYLINIDSEEEGYIYAGCAGGARVYLDMPVERDGSQAGDAYLNDTEQIYQIKIAGCRGGHSGSEIDRGGANAIILAGRILYKLIHNGHPDSECNNSAVRFISLTGGHVDNAIPTSSVLTIASSDINEALKSILEDIISEYAATDPEMSISVKGLTGNETDTIASPASFESTYMIADLLMSLPNGVQAMSSDIEGLVETSLNLGVAHTFDGHIILQFSVRSSVESSKEALIDTLYALAHMAGAAVRVSGSYPGWKYRQDSPLREHLTGVYRSMYDKEPVIKAIHAGLECGFFISAIPGLDCVSIGPDMYDVHTTKEHLSISSVARTWEYLLEVLCTWRLNM